MRIKLMATKTLAQVNTERCPEEVVGALTDILRESLLNIRMGGNGGDADYCAMEANHTHNLPGLVRHYSRAGLERYLTWARSGYTQEFERRFHRPPTMFLPAWQQLEAFLTGDQEQRESAPEHAVTA